eukprot:876195-Prorocentrum_lima.AAC.1
MTSSLVGSEMCIRDSCWNETVLGALCFWSELDVDQGWLRFLSSHDQPPSVSYTHLTLPTICSV